MTAVVRKKWRACLACSRPVTGDPRRIYCGEACKKEMRRLANLDSATRRNAKRQAARIKAKRCRWCDKTFTTISATQYCCTDACGRRWRSARCIERRSIERAKALPKTLTCPECGAQYPNKTRGKGSAAKRCPPCRLANIRRSNRETAARARALLVAEGRCEKKDLTAPCTQCGAAIPQARRGSPRLYCDPCADVRRTEQERVRGKLRRERRHHDATVLRQKAALAAGGQVEHGDTLADRRAAMYAAVVAAADEAQRTAEAMRAADPQSVYAYTCAQCGVDALAPHRHGGKPRRYCLRCRPVGVTRAPKAPRPERACGYCGRLFAPWREQQRCCCETCSHRWQSMRRQERIVAKREAAKAAAKAGTK